MNTQHTPEPWAIKIETNGIIAGSEGQYTVAWCYNDYDLSEPDRSANAERIVACVNACAGMKDPAKEIAELRAEIARLKNPPTAPTCDELDYDSRS